MSEDDPKLLKAAEAVADGTPYPWAAASGDPDTADILRGLRLIEGVANAHRALPLTGSAGGAPPAEAPPGSPNRWGSFDLRERIGEGRFSEVYRCFDAVLQRDVALKLGKPRSSEPEDGSVKLLEDARRLARVRHRGVITIYGAEDRDGRIGIWMDLIQGRTLEEELQLQGPLIPLDVTTTGCELSRALGAIHAAGIVHREVNTDKVMREEGGRVVLMGFGLGREFIPGGDPVISQHVRGTPLALAPEQLRGEVAGPPTDLYGLGVLLYRLLTRHFPIEAATFQELAEAHRKGRVRPIRDLRPDVPQSLVRVIERALDPDSSRRYATALAMERALADAAGDGEMRTERGGIRKPRPPS